MYQSSDTIFMWLRHVHLQFFLCVIYLMKIKERKNEQSYYIIFIHYVQKYEIWNIDNLKMFLQIV